MRLRGGGSAVGDGRRGGRPDLRALHCWCRRARRVVFVEAKALLHENLQGVRRDGVADTLELFRWSVGGKVYNLVHLVVIAAEEADVRLIE